MAGHLAIGCRIASGRASSSFPVVGRRGHSSLLIKVFSDFGLVTIQLFLVLSAITLQELIPQSSLTTQLNSTAMLHADGRRSSGVGLMVVDGAAMSPVVSIGSRLMPRYECCCDNCPRRPCFICRNLDFACNCASCSCYADQHSTQPPQPYHPPQLSVDEDDDVPLLRVHRVRHNRPRYTSHQRRYKMDFAVTSAPDSNAFIDRLLQRHSPTQAVSKASSGRDRTD